MMIYGKLIPPTVKPHTFKLSASCTALALMTAVAVNPVAAQSDTTPARGFDDIIVTAQKREQSLLQIPSSISVKSGDELELARVNNIDDIALVAPNIRMFNRAGSALENYISIRGVVTQNIGSPAVSTFIDGVPVGSLLLDGGLFDIERIEVLRGPVGTLYGKSSTAGAVNIITRTAGDTWRGRVEGSYGQDGYLDITGSASGPLSDTLGLSIAVFNQQSDGWETNSFNGTKANPFNTTSLRGRLEWQPGEKTSVSLVLGHIDNETFSFTRRAAATPNSALAPYRNDQRSLTSVTSSYGSITINQELGLGSLIALAAFNDYSNLQLIDFDYCCRTAPPFNFRAPAKGADYAAEVRWLVTSPDWVDFVVGGFYGGGKVTQDSDTFVPFNNPLPALVSEFSGSSYALFGEATFKVNTIELTLGGRHDWDRNSSNVGTPTSRFKKFLPKAAIRWQPIEDLSVYALYSTGYRGGGANRPGSAPADKLQFGPETVKNYEVGMKASALDGTLTFSGAVYLMDFTGLQAQTRIFTDSGFIEFTDNNGSARNKGVEAEVVVRPVDSLSVGIGFGYNDFRYTDFTNSGVVLDGKKVLNSTDLSGLVNVSYETPVSDTWRVYTRGDLSLTGPIVFDRDNVFVQSSYVLANLRLGVKSDKLDFSFWAKNIFDETYLIEFAPGGVRVGTDIGGITGRTNGGTRGTPRQIGGTIGFRF